MKTIFAIKPHEKESIFYLFLIMLIFACINVIGRSIGMTLLVAKYGDSILPITFITTDISVMIGSILYAKSSRYFNDITILKYLIVLFIAFVSVISLITNQHSQQILFIFFIGFSLFNILINIHMATFIATYFNVIDLKRLAPVLYSGIPIGGIIGGISVMFLSQHFNITDIIKILPAIALINIFLLYALNQHIIPLTTNDAIKSNHKKTFNQQTKQLWHVLTQNRLLRWMTLCLIFFVITSRLLEYVYQGIIYPEAFPDIQARAIFFGQYELIANSIWLAIQLSFFGYLLNRLGIGLTNALYPILTAVTACGLFYQTGLMAGIITQFINQEMRGAIRTPAHNLLFNAIKPKRWATCKAYLNGFIFPFSTLLASLLLLNLTNHEHKLTIILIFVLLFSVAGIIAAVYQSKQYQISMLELLQQKLNLTDNSFQQTPEKQIAYYLKHHNNAYQIIALKMIKQLKAEQFIHEIGLMLLHHSHFEIKREAANTLKTLSNKNESMTYLIKSLRFEKDPKTIEMILTILREFKEEDYQSSIERYLLHPEPRIFQTACCCLYHNHHYQHQATLKSQLQLRLLQANINDQVRLIKTYQTMGTPEDDALIQQFLNHQNPGLHLAALETLSTLHHDHAQQHYDIYKMELTQQDAKNKILALNGLKSCKPLRDISIIIHLLTDPNNNVQQSTIELIRYHIHAYQKSLVPFIFKSDQSATISYHLAPIILPRLNQHDKKEIYQQLIIASRILIQCKIIKHLMPAHYYSDRHYQLITKCINEIEQTHLTYLLLWIVQNANKTMRFYHRIFNGLISCDKKNQGNALEVLSHLPKSDFSALVMSLYEHHSLAHINTIYHLRFPEQVIINENNWQDILIQFPHPVLIACLSHVKNH